jgi:uncharacterized protein (DUF427 family)
VPASTPCPPADASDREAAHVAASHPGQGWSLLCNDVVMFEDAGALLPDGRCIPPHRPPWIGGHHDYPQMVAKINHVEPAPRRVRATLGGEQIFDTTRARYVWEWPYYPQYYIPAEDADPCFLVDEHHEQRLRQGTVRRHGLRAGGLDRPGTVRVFGGDAINGVAGTARFDWDALDAWYEEDEQVFVHPSNPYVRVDALRSHRRVRASLEGVTLAETATPVLVFETGLPTRYYFDRTDVAFAHLVPTGTQGVCPSGCRGGAGFPPPASPG